MQRAIYCLAFLVLAANLQAQENTPATAAVDKVSQQATQLEAELGKYKDTSPEAADVLVKLVDLYHSDGRVFGLIRAGQRFAASHPEDKRHQEVMLKLIDGLEAMSRNRDLTVACRQFLVRYPTSPQRADITRRLAYTLEVMNERTPAAEAYRDLWNLQPNANSRDDGQKAVQLFALSTNKNDMHAAGELAEVMLDKLPAGSFSELVAWNGFLQFRRASEWAEANALGRKMLAKGLPKDKDRLHELHRYMAEHYGSQTQYVNAVESYQKARAMRPNDQNTHYYLIQQMYNAQMTGAQLLPVVNEYLKLYPDRADRFDRIGLLGLSYRRDGDNVRARQTFELALPHNSIVHSIATNYLNSFANEEAENKAAEAGLKKALAANKNDPYYLQYVLGFSLYRDRMKDIPQAKATLRQMFAEPPNASYASTAMQYLFDMAETEAEFNRDLDLVLRSRAANMDYTSLRSYPEAWADAREATIDRKKAAGTELTPADQMLVANIKSLRTKIAAADKDPVAAIWLSLPTKDGWTTDQVVRDQLLDPKYKSQISARQREMLLERQAYYMDRYPPTTERFKACDYYAELTAMLPNNYDYAKRFLTAATNYGDETIRQAACQHMLKQQPPMNDSDAWRRMMSVAALTKDAALAKATFAWLQASQQKYGLDPVAASYIGDVLVQFEMETEAVAYWKSHYTLDPNNSESRDCALRLAARMETDAAKIPLYTPLFAVDSNWHGDYAVVLADLYVKTGNLPAAVKVLEETTKRQAERPFLPWGVNVSTLSTVFNSVKNNMEIADDAKLPLYHAVSAMHYDWPTAVADLTLADLTPVDSVAPMVRLLMYQRPTRVNPPDSTRWDQLMPYAQAAMNRDDHLAAATLVTGMLSNLTSAQAQRLQAGRAMVARSYAKIGSVGLTIDESSPTAPLLRAALYLRLGDERLAFDAYTANKALFETHQDELPVDLIRFVCERLMAAGGNDNHDKVESILRNWIIKHAESAQVDAAAKADIQLLLARNYFKSQRFDLSRSEFTTVMNRYPDTPQAIEAEFGIGETFLAQKVFDQAEQAFQKLAANQGLDISVRAEFLLGVLAFRRGDHEDARDIFRSVLERSPKIELANQTLFSLSEVFGAEERYLDQLNLLRTVGRLGRESKRVHRPGLPLSIVVNDSDLGISRGHSRIEVIVSTEPGGDRERAFLISGGASKGLFRVDLDTQLGSANPGDGVLQLTGRDVVRCDYPDEFKKEFQRVPLSDVEIRIASDALFEIASAKIIDQKLESFAERLEREQREEEEADMRLSQGRPASQIKPGNPIYLRVKDPDRDLGDEPDTIPVKLTANSGDQVQITLTETGPHTGVFEGVVATGELPAGAQASDFSIDRTPLMAIDHDPETYWMSEPDGASPKSISVDLKDLKMVSRVKITSPQADTNTPIRGDLLGSQDGEFWVRLASYPKRDLAAPLVGDYGRMQQRVFPGNYTGLRSWQQVVNMTRDETAVSQVEPKELSWGKETDEENADNPYAVVWHGYLPQHRAGAVRFGVNGALTALVIDGIEELPLGAGNRQADVWLEAGLHHVSIFAATPAASRRVSAEWVKANFQETNIALRPFQELDFDLRGFEIPQPVDPTVVTAPEGTIVLEAADAVLNKVSETFGLKDGKTTKKKGEEPPRLTNWASLEDTVSWEIDFPEPGLYEVVIEQAHVGGGGKYQLLIGDQVIEAVTQNTGKTTTYQPVRIGGIAIDKAGKQTLTLKPTELAGDVVMGLESVSLEPVRQTTLFSERTWDFRIQPIELRYTRFDVQEYVGEAVAVSNLEVGQAPDVVHVPTDADVLALANNEILEMAGGDVVKASYADEFTQNLNSGSRLLTDELTATYFDATVDAIAYDLVRAPNGAVQTLPKRLMRVEPGDRIIVQIQDYDRDQSAARDTVQFEVVVNDGEPIVMTATETEQYSGIFTKEVDTAAAAAEGKLQVKPGDRVYCRYTDSQNTFPGHAVPREAAVLVNEPSAGLVRVLESRLIPNRNRDLPPTAAYSVPEMESKTAGVALEAPLTIEVIDPDAAKDSRSSVIVTLTTTDGATIDVECKVSGAFNSSGVSSTGRNNQADDMALSQGRFVGQVILQLGGKSTPSMVPLTADMPRYLVGGPVREEGAAIDDLVTTVLNVGGQDVITAVYNDERRPEGKAVKLESQARLIVNGQLARTDRDYNDTEEGLHVGEKLFLRVVDADRDTSDERDIVEVQVASTAGEKETVQLVESLAHSGVFTASFELKANAEPVAGNLDPADPVIETYFGETLQISYVDPTASTDTGELEVTIEAPVVIGTNGLVAAFTKVFNNEDLAIETKFHVAESYFELFKSHRQLDRSEELQADLEAGRRVLREVMEDYPDPKYAPRVAYLLGQFAQELEQWDEAIRSYDLIIRQYPDHTLAADAHYKMSQCYEESGDFDKALEGYVVLAATYPNSPLIASVMIRISDYFYKNETYDVAAQVGIKFLEKFQGHQHASRMAFRIGQCYYKAKEYKKGGESFDAFVKMFPDDSLASDALFWAGESYRQANDNSFAFRRYNRCRWDFPASEAAKYARGRLALPEMINQFEQEAANLEE
ncbi:tetratricopeptide repeat protein [Lignipirellula cremea]|uniref:Tol-pal system protein YbgF n=1 Tax=Lignipirellula cremea TaxID=2528010 RepID=A0A518DM87_9BACT|nr:tetratricopeptide repeat protein [Lignipirellula cremea]QDU92957.1 tol-pal system protein YbgF [Lignipirellula cremea]